MCGQHCFFQYLQNCCTLIKLSVNFDVMYHENSCILRTFMNYQILIVNVFVYSCKNLCTKYCFPKWLSSSEQTLHVKRKWICFSIQIW